jgi:hypothetical protein
MILNDFHIFRGWLNQQPAIVEGSTVIDEAPGQKEKVLLPSHIECSPQKGKTR